MNRDCFRLMHPLKVRWNECDMHGIVFNVNYFLYYDIAMYEWQRAVGYSGAEQPDFVTAHAECDYLQSAKFDDDLDIGMRCAGIGEKSITLEAAVFRGAEMLNRGKVVYVHIVKGQSTASQIGQDFIDRVRAFEKVAPLSAAGGSSA